MEFYADGAKGITYEGLSVFQTQTKGAFLKDFLEVLPSALKAGRDKLDSMKDDVDGLVDLARSLGNDQLSRETALCELFQKRSCSRSTASTCVSQRSTGRSGAANRWWYQPGERTPAP